MDNITKVYPVTTPNYEFRTEGNLIENTTASFAQTEDPVKLQMRVILRIASLVTLCIVMTGMGCSAEIREVLQHLKKPAGILIGLVSQFGVMPALAFASAKIFSMEDPETLSVLIIGSCPGGTLSNIISFWLGADMELSMTMTTISVICSLGTMPLLLYLYSLSFGMNTISVPFLAIGISIATTVVPLSIGMFIRYKRPVHAKRIVKAASIIGFILIVGFFAVILYTYGGDWLQELPVRQIITALWLPLTGMLLGYSISSIVSLVPTLHLNHAQRRTISVETGIQNVQIATTIIEISGWSIAITARLIILPMMYFFFQLSWSLAFVACYRLYLSVKRRRAERNLQGQTESTNGEVNPAFEDNEESNDEKQSGNSRL